MLTFCPVIYLVTSGAVTSPSPSPSSPSHLFWIVFYGYKLPLLSNTVYFTFHFLLPQFSHQSINLPGSAGTTCPFPYTAIHGGDIIGRGLTFDHVSQTHYTPETCAGYCEASTLCCSFEIDAEGLSSICYLNEECNPDRTNLVPSQLFCTKGKVNGIRSDTPTG